MGRYQSCPPTTHPSDGWTVPSFNPVGSEWDYPCHKTIEERIQSTKRHQEVTKAQLGQEEPPPFVCDSMEDSLDQVYEARPYRALVVDADSLEILYSDAFFPLSSETKDKHAENFFGSATHEMARLWRAFGSSV